MSDVPATAGAPATAPAPAADAAAPAAAQVQAGFKQCSACSKSLHPSAFSGAQLKLSGTKRKCMQCVLNANKATEASAAAAAAVSSSQAQTQSQTQGGAKKGGKANTPGAIARERAAARTAAASSSSIIAPPGSKTNNPASIFNTPRLKKKKAPKSGGAGAGSSAAGADGGLLDDDDDWFLPRTEEVLVDVFRRFDSTHASAPATPRDSLRWSLTDIQRFAQVTNERPFSTEELMEISDNLTHDEEGNLTCQGFLDFYHLQTSSHPEETWKDLKRLGYNRELQLEQR